MNTYENAVPKPLKFLHSDGKMVDDEGNVIADSPTLKDFYDQAAPQVQKLLLSDGSVVDENNNLIIKNDYYKKMYDQITCGSPAVFYNNADGESNFYLFNTKQSFIADDLQELKRNIINEFLTEIGINNANLGKRERLITDEVNANNEEIYANIEHWLTNIREGFNKANAMFGLN